MRIGTVPDSAVRRNHEYRLGGADRLEGARRRRGGDEQGRGPGAATGREHALTRGRGHKHGLAARAGDSGVTSTSTTSISVRSVEASITSGPDGTSASFSTFRADIEIVRSATSEEAASSFQARLTVLSASFSTGTTSSSGTATPTVPAPSEDAPSSSPTPAVDTSSTPGADIPVVDPAATPVVDTDVLDATPEPAAAVGEASTLILDGSGFGADLVIPADVFDPLDELREAVEESTDGPVEELQEVLAEQIAQALEEEREEMAVHRV